MAAKAKAEAEASATSAALLVSGGACSANLTGEDLAPGTDLYNAVFSVTDESAADRR